MSILNAQTVPYLFLAIAVFFLFTWVRARRSDPAGQAIAQKNRLRMAVIFGVIGAFQLVRHLMRAGAADGG